MKAILEFNLPEDQFDFNLANDAGKMYTALREYDKLLRQILKHTPDNITDEQLGIYVECREYLLDVLDDNNVNLDI